MFKIKGKYNSANVFATTIDDETISQITELCNQEWTQGSNIAIMPDCHTGKDCTIGTTMTIVDKVCPNLVGVDIGCGMLTIMLPTVLKDLSLEKLDKFINTNIPSGFEVNEERLYNPAIEGLWLEQLNCYSHLKNKEQLEKAIGSLGGGNHFIEVSKDKYDNLYLIIHTGSRNLGKQVAEYYQNMAFEDCNKQKERKKSEREQLISYYKSIGKTSEIEAALKKFNETYQEELKVQKDLCYLEGIHLNDYLHDMYVCQQFAKLNRKLIATRILEHLFIEKYHNKDACIWVDRDNNYRYNDGTHPCQMPMYETIHNYIDSDDRILRKGAISAKRGETVLIPINMRDGSLLCRGKGNPSYNFSGPHGAGRLMSRNIAKEEISFEEFKESMKGIYSSSVTESTIDESPMAYKGLDDILGNIEDTVDVVSILKPIYNFKAH